MKRILSVFMVVVLAVAMMFPVANAKADSTEGALISYISFGADLKPAEKTKVMELLDVTEDELANFKVLQVTNAEEHKYLGNYLSSRVIGSRALSSVRVERADDGAGIGVDTHNISYCTSGMYTNALITAGVKDADITVAGPFKISGTAALVGVMKAYEIMTGEEISEKQMDAANNELVVQGKLGESLDEGKATEFIAAVKQKVVEGNLSSSEEIGQAIDKAADEVGVNLTPEQKSEVTSLMNKIKDLDIDTDSLKEQAKGIYDKLVNMGIDMDSAKGFFEKLGDFFVDIGNQIGDFLSGLF